MQLIGLSLGGSSMQCIWGKAMTADRLCWRFGLPFAAFIALAGCSAAPGEPGENNTNCGNGVREPGEQCEGTDLGGQTCEGLSLGSGTLSCTGCFFDTSGCSDCGNGVCDPTESRTGCPADCGVRLLAAGEYHACAAMGDGTLWCWGSNFHGTFGNGTYESSPVPVQVPGIDGVVDLCAAVLQTCALLTDGTVRCWGGTTGRRCWGMAQGTRALYPSKSLAWVMGPISPVVLSTPAS
jgi:hypothetical protein